MKRNYKFLLTAILILIGGKDALSSTFNGDLGATSTGAFDVSLTIAETFKISGMKEMAFEEWSGSGSLESNYNACVYHNGDSSYQVTISDNSTLNTGFALEDSGKLNDIEMSVFFNDEMSTSNNTLLTEGSPTGPLLGANVLAQDCDGNNNINIQVTIDENSLATAPPGVYQSQITILVTPD